jgi:hypothetical protein
MVDPASAAMIASSAFAAIKKGFSIGRDLESMAGDLSRWMGALSDLDQAEKEAKNPPLFKKMFNGESVEAESIRVFAARRKAQSQREELRNWISFTLGKSAWDELVRTEADIRKKRQETLYKQREKRRKFVEALTIIFLVLLLGGAMILLIYFLIKAKGA